MATASISAFAKSSPTCHATLQFRRKERGELTITTLGTSPELSIKEARLKAAELATKRQTSSPTVQEVAEQWLAERIDHTHRKADQVRGYADRAINPELGSARVRDIDPSDIARVIRSYRDRVAKLPRARTGGRPAAHLPWRGPVSSLTTRCGSPASQISSSLHSELKPEAACSATSRAAAHVRKPTASPGLDSSHGPAPSPARCPWR
jgi:hypothetical protein